MSRWLPLQPAVVLVVLATAIVLTIPVAMAVGTVDVPFRDVVGALFGADVADRTHRVVITTLRAPRALAAVLIGAILGSCGAALQSALRNPLADPFLLGVSAGAGLGASLALTGAAPGRWGLTVAAFAGAIAAIALVSGLGATRRGMSTGRLILAGITVSYLLSAATGLVVVFADNPNRVRSLLFWTMGSLTRVDWAAVAVLLPITVVVVALLTLGGRRLDALALGDDVADSLGYPPARVRAAVALVTSLGVATAVAYSGSVGFVGLVIPHIARRIGGASSVVAVPVSALLGALVLLWSDTVARTALEPREIPLGVVTALIGSPVLLVLIRSRLTD